MAGTMAVSLTACSNNANSDTTTAPSTTEAVTTTEAATEQTTTEPSVTSNASIDFEDGQMGFVEVYSAPANAADVELNVVDFGGSKALEVKNLTGKVPFVGIDVSSLCGADTAKIASVSMKLGVSYEDGSFSACAGKITTWTGEDLVQTGYDWSVYMESKNPKVATVDVSGVPFVADAKNIMVLSLETDNGIDAGHGNATLYVDDITFYDASGNVLTADQSVAFAAPAGYSDSGRDSSNLFAVKNAVEFEGFQTSADAWTQAGFTMPQEILDALVPGSVVEIEYKSETGNMWLVMNEAQAGWMRVGQAGTEDPALCDGQKCYVTYEQIAALCGDDVSTWGARMQCEADGEWEVYSVKVGTAAEFAPVNKLVAFEGFETSGDAWAQAGFTMPQEILDALVPGAVVTIQYSSETGNIWIVMNEAQAGWMRVGQAGTEDPALCNGTYAQITYEQLAALCTDDVSTWGSTMQCEADGAWEVYGVWVSTPATSAE